MPDGSAPALTATGVSAIADIARADWDRLVHSPRQANGPRQVNGPRQDSGPQQAFHPFAAYDFLDALERSGSVCAETGWQPHHLTLYRDEALVGIMPLYLKGHSQGEYVFDHAWAEAYQRAGGRYYPKLLGAVPFTPATGPRLFAPSAEDRLQLANAARQMADQLGVSSLHVNFPDIEDCQTLEEVGYLIRTGQQFHFEDQDFGDWAGFLAALSSRKRKALRKERDAIAQSDLTIEWITGGDITEAVLDAFWVFYQDTGARKWGTPYLTRQFFSMITETMADHILFIMAKRDGRYVAGAMNMIGGETLYGRYWGCTEHVPFLHFELCYYQAIDYALAHGIRRVEAGAQGEHKIARGYTPAQTYSAHWISNDGFRDAVAHYLTAEREEVADAMAFLSDYAPFKSP